MKIKSFPTDQEQEINEFLAENSTKVIENGISVFENRIVFLYNDETDEERRTRYLRGQIKARILQMQDQLAGQEAKKLYYQGQVLKGEQGAQNKVVDTANEADNTRAQIHYSEEILKQIEEVNFFENAKETGIQKK